MSHQTKKDKYAAANDRKVLEGLYEEQREREDRERWTRLTDSLIRLGELR